MCSRSHHRLVVTSQGHRHETHGYGAGFGCRELAEALFENGRKSISAGCIPFFAMFESC
jgi:hypothetical protein